MTRSEALIEIEASRAAIARDYRGLRAASDVPTRLKQTFRRHPIPWLGGAATLGWIIAGRGRGRKKVMLEKRVGEDGKVTNEKIKSFSILTVLITLIRVVLPLLKPALTALAAKKFADLAVKLK